MSHLKERKEKNCLNCNAILYGSYCHICGQENLEPKESVWHLISHFFKDITHFDGKFFSSLKLLLTRPGFLSREYNVGRRASYLNPIRMYVFTSAFFFLLFFSFFNEDKPNEQNNPEKLKLNGKTLAEARAMPLAQFKMYTSELSGTDTAKGKPMTFTEFVSIRDSLLQSGFKKALDSLEKKSKKNNNWLNQIAIDQLIKILKKNHNAINYLDKDLTYHLIHKLPQLLFISLPLFAFLLRLLYIRRKPFYYVSHGIFAIHFYIFIFIALLLIYTASAIGAKFNLPWLNTMAGFGSLGIFLYQYKAMRNFYGQGRIKTIIKFILLNIMNLIVLAILFAAFFILIFL